MLFFDVNIYNRLSLMPSLLLMFVEIYSTCGVSNVRRGVLRGMQPRVLIKLGLGRFIYITKKI